jgi:hypothetical protein
MAEEFEASAALVPVRQQQVDFYGDVLLAGQLADGTILVPLRPICEALGLVWAAQYNRLKRDQVLAPALTVSVTETIQGPRPMLCLPLKLLPGFLFGLQPSRVKPELRDKIVRYQQDCYEVLWNAFKADILPTPPTTGASGAALALEIAEAITALARQQLALEGRFDGLEGRVGTMADYLRGYIVKSEQRFDALELRLSEGTTISEAEAAELALHVKTVAAALEAQGRANGYQRVYAELYRRFRIASYKNLPRARYAEALAWLAAWAQELEGQGT